jgi:hypothetical protein
MMIHIVLFRPRNGLPSSAREAMLQALRAAASEIPSVRRFHVCTRVKHGRPYEQAMADDYPYAAIVEFDDLPGLQAYLDHPAHQTLGALFYEFLDAGLVYDYQMKTPGENAFDPFQEPR